MSLLPQTLSLGQLRLRENRIFLALTIVIGVLAGLSAVLFSLAINATAHGLFGVTPSTARLLLVPPLVSLVTGVLLWRVFPRVRGSGVPQTKAAFHLHGGVIPIAVPVGKFLTGALCIGSGHSIGREGPSVQIGAGLASAVGQWLRLSPTRLKELVPVGAAAALSAAFNTPVAAVVFALEEVIGDMNATLLGSTVVASVAAVVVERSILGNEPLFHVPVYHLVHPAELLAYALLGIVGGFMSLLFCTGLLRARRLVARLPRWTVPLQPALGGLAIGVILVYVPEVMGVGYEYVDQALNGGLVWKTLLLLCAVKMLATIASYSSGNAGGVFAPSLYIGAMVGGAVGVVVHAVAPAHTGGPGAYALVGMGVLFAGIIRAPMTSVFMIFEITQDYQILVPLMVANLLSFVISRRYQPIPLYHALLLQDGIHLAAPEAQTERPSWTARDVMDNHPVWVSAEATIAEAHAAAVQARLPVVLVGTPRQLVGQATLAQLAEAAAAGQGEEAVSTIMASSPVHLHADHGLATVIERLAESAGVVPVVSRSNSQRLEGVVTRRSLAAFFHSDPPNTPQ